MDTLTLLLSFIFGAIVGSFLNVVAIRFNTGISVGGRSKCMSCGSALSWSELIPLVSFFFQRGLCKKCKTKISWQYPLVEFAAGAIFVLVFITFPPVSLLSAVTTLIQVIIACLLIVISVYDIKHKIIPDRFVYTFSFIALANLFIGGSTWFHVPVWHALLAGPVLALPFAFIWAVSSGKWMGLGDAKLVLGLGWLLGIASGINALILAFWIATVFSVAYMLSTYKSFKSKTEIPFGPYLILGAYIILFFKVDIIDVQLIKELIFGYF